MGKEKTFCPECRKDETYSVKREVLHGNLKGQNIEYEGEAAYCDNCGSEIYIGVINDSNLDILYEEYRKQNNLVSPEIINEVLERYNIGKRPLSLLLGWGEQTVSRYLDGYIPTQQYSDELMKIYHEPEYYYALLERNRHNLVSQLTYNKSRQAVEKLFDQHDGKGINIDTIVRYLLYKAEDITPLTLQKALYYVQGFYYAFNNDYLLSEDCEAWAHGPVFRKIYYRYKDFNYDEIEKPAYFDDSIFTNMEKLLLDSVVKYFCCYSGKILEAFTHMEKPWLQAREGLKVSEGSDRVIPKEDIGSFFSGKREQYGMESPVDIGMYSLDMFNKTINNL
jgi:putative zinc finger/helix-turn-helix YgiT family protein